MATRPDPYLVELRPMRDGDIESVQENERAAYAFPWNEAILRDCLGAGYACWVAEDASGVIGHSVLSIAAGEAHLLNICVHPAMHRQGVGRRLLYNALETARGHAARKLYLEVRPTNAPAIALYHDCGFTRIGVRHGYYPARTGKREDAIVYEMKL